MPALEAEDASVAASMLLANSLLRSDATAEREAMLLDAELAARLAEEERESAVATALSVALDARKAEELQRTLDASAANSHAEREAALRADEAAARELAALELRESEEERARRKESARIADAEAARLAEELAREEAAAEEESLRLAQDLAERLEMEERGAEEESLRVASTLAGAEARERGAPEGPAALLEDPSAVAVCAICAEERAGRELFVLDHCYHVFCYECLRRHIVSRMESSRATDVPCPDPGCKRQLDPAEIRHCFTACLDAAGFERFNNLALQDTLARTPEVRWCPRPGCNAALIGDPHAATPRIRCPAEGCGLDFCYNCKDPWHEDMTCEEYAVHRDSTGDTGEAQLRKWLSENTKGCPRCQTAIEKDEGCNHIICANCKHEWCWVCGKKWNRLHHFCF